MKKVTIFLAIISLMVTACKSTQQLASSTNDDVYAVSSKNAKPSYSQAKNYDSPQVITSPDSSSTIKSGSATWADDYNNYAYSSRIKRFNSTGSQKSYYDETYTSPSNYDTTIYINQEPEVNVFVGAGNSWDNWYGPSLSFGIGWGWGSCGWGYDPWYWGWGYPYSWPYWGGYGYGYGYWNGYWDGYWDGYYGYPPYYDYAYNSYYYGPRTATSSDIGTRVDRSQRTSNSQGLQQTTRNERTVVPERNTRSTLDPSSTRNISSAQPAANRLPSNQEKYRYAKPTADRQAPSQRSSTQYQRQKEQPTPKYTRPEVSNQAQRTTQTQSYASPAYRQPKSSQEYINPRSQNPGVSRTTNNSHENRSTIPARSNSQHRYSSPGNTSKTYGTPSRSSGTPTRSYTPSSSSSRSSERGYSTPSRSSSSGSGSYSAPARSSSGGSYSAPSRSTGGSAPSSGGGGRHR